MAKVVLVYSEKGGVGKTTTTFSISNFLASAGLKVLMIDLDPNNSLTSHCVSDINQVAGRTIKEVLNGEVQPITAQIKIRDNLYIIGALKTLTKLEKDQSDNPDQFLILKDRIAEIENSYDYIILDAPPASNLITKAALISANIVIIPTKLEQFDTSSVSGVFSEINRCARQRNGIPFEKLFILPTFYEERNSVNAMFLEALNKKYSGMVSQTYIHKATAVSKANISPDSFLDPKSRAYAEYKSVVKEMLQVDLYE